MAKKLELEGNRRSSCPIAAGLDIVGDKWTLLLIRDMGMFNKHRNKDFQNAIEGIPSNILASRLKQLHDYGLIEKRLYQSNPARYEYHLTDAGRALLPVVKAIARWSLDHVEGVVLPG